MPAVEPIGFLSVVAIDVVQARCVLEDCLVPDRASGWNIDCGGHRGGVERGFPGGDKGVDYLLPSIVRSFGLGCIDSALWVVILLRPYVAHVVCFGTVVLWRASQRGLSSVRVERGKLPR